MGGGSGGGRGIGGTSRKGSVVKYSATRPGRFQRSRTDREVGWEGQANIWDVVWGAELQEGQLGLSAQPILSL